MKTRTITGAVAACVVVALTTTVVFAVMGPPESSTKIKGSTTITWDSSFQDPDYILGSTITFTVNWSVDDGAADYNDFSLKVNPQGKGGFTPRGKDPATGTTPVVTAQSGNSVTVQFKFTGLHLDKERDVEIGNAHFMLYLNIDKIGDDGVLDSVVGYGVNVHVEDPQDPQ
jgi:hypothetical protein